MEQDSMDLRNDCLVRGMNHQNPTTHNRAIYHLKEIFRKHSQELQNVKDIAEKIKDGIERISPFIQQNTETVCPACKEVCCIRKHGYYNYEDLVYLHALGLRLPEYKFGGEDSDPCRFLSKSGCSLERPFRPSGCNWYFCDPLLGQIEKKPYYQEFDNRLSEIADMWLKMMEEFFRVIEQAEKTLNSVSPFSYTS